MYLHFIESPEMPRLSIYLEYIVLTKSQLLKILLCHLTCAFSTDLASVNIKEEDLEILEEIGKGQFGRVHKGLWKGMQVAVKEMPLGYGEPDLSEVLLCR